MVEEHHDGSEHGISIWFFIGSLLTAYGIIVLVANLLPSSGPEAHVVLSELHDGIWWGIILIALGAVYVTLFRPGRK